MLTINLLHVESGEVWDTHGNERLGLFHFHNIHWYLHCYSVKDENARINMLYGQGLFHFHNI